MKNKSSDKFFSDINFISIVDNIKGIYTSNGTMSTLLDYERVLDEADLYAFKNWSLGELVQGPDMGRYTATCVFMWPHKLMPDPRGAIRLVNIGCKVEVAKSKIKVPVEVKNYDDFQAGGKYPKMVEKPVWFIRIEIPVELMDDIKEGSIDLADSQIDLADLDDAYDEDLDKQTTEDADQQEQTQEQPDDTMDSAPPVPM
jgi:hypothetical protein